MIIEKEYLQFDFDYQALYEDDVVCLFPATKDIGVDIGVCTKTLFNRSRQIAYYYKYLIKC